MMTAGTLEACMVVTMDAGMAGESTAASTLRYTATKRRPGRGGTSDSSARHTHTHTHVVAV